MLIARVMQREKQRRERELKKLETLLPETRWEKEMEEDAGQPPGQHSLREEEQARQEAYRGPRDNEETR